MFKSRNDRGFDDLPYTLVGICILRLIASFRSRLKIDFKNLVARDNLKCDHQLSLNDCLHEFNPTNSKKLVNELVSPIAG